MKLDWHFSWWENIIFITILSIFILGGVLSDFDSDDVDSTDISAEERQISQMRNARVEIEPEDLKKFAEDIHIFDSSELIMSSIQRLDADISIAGIIFRFNDLTEQITIEYPEGKLNESGKAFIEWLEQYFSKERYCK